MLLQVGLHLLLERNPIRVLIDVQPRTLLVRRPLIHDIDIHHIWFWVGALKAWLAVAVTPLRASSLAFSSALSGAVITIRGGAPLLGSFWNN